MQSLPAARAASNPVCYLHEAWDELPRIFRAGAPAARVEALLGGLVPALQTFDVPHGSAVRVWLYPEPWGWSLDHVPDNGVRIAYEDAPAPDRLGRTMNPAFRCGEDTGILFARSGGRWVNWNPADGPAPTPDRDRMHLKLVVLHGREERPTICWFAEVYGRDLPFPLHKTEVSLAPASAEATDHLLGVLRGLLVDASAGGV